MKEKLSVRILKGIGAAVLLFIALFPIYWLLVMGVRETNDLIGSISLIPRGVTFLHFKELFASNGFGRAIVNSLQTTFGSLIVSLVVGILGAAGARAAARGLHDPAVHHV